MGSMAVGQVWLTLVAIATAEGHDSKLLHWKMSADGGLYIGGGRAKRLIQFNEELMPDTLHQACTLPSGEMGRCRPLRHCVQEDFKQDFMKIIDYLCVIKGSSVGVCCAESDTPGLAGDLPAVAPRDESNEAVLRSIHAQSRGCGLSTRAQGRLVGARPADPREWPWMASVTPEGFQQYCGGVLITDRHVLTAAHCTRRWKAEELYVRLGEYDMGRNNDSRTYNFRVVEKRQHPLFDKSNYHHDVAILKLHRPAMFNTYVWPICLPPQGLDVTNQSAVIVGWGTQWYGGPNSDVLMEVAVPVWEHQKCVESFTDSIFEESICAGGREGGKDACQGDSGGPLMYQLPSGRWTTVGIVSWGIRCGEPNHPGIYVRVDKYLGWIIENATF